MIRSRRIWSCGIYGWRYLLRPGLEYAMKPSFTWDKKGLKWGFHGHLRCLYGVCVNHLDKRFYGPKTPWNRFTRSTPKPLWITPKFTVCAWSYKAKLQICAISLVQAKGWCCSFPGHGLAHVRILIISKYPHIIAWFTNIQPFLEAFADQKKKKRNHWASSEEMYSVLGFAKNSTEPHKYIPQRNLWDSGHVSRILHMSICVVVASKKNWSV